MNQSLFIKQGCDPSKNYYGNQKLTVVWILLLRFLDIQEQHICMRSKSKGWREKLCQVKLF